MVFTVRSHFVASQDHMHCSQFFKTSCSKSSSCSFDRTDVDTNQEIYSNAFFAFKNSVYIKMKVFLFVLLVSFTATMAKPGNAWEKDWNDWKIQFGKTYTNEETMRRRIWESNMHLVTKHNYEYDQGLHTYKLGMNKFADMDSKEFKALYLSEMRRVSTDCKNATFLSLDLGITNPAKVDWRTEGFVTPVKNQGQCGSCWAFSTTGSVEGQHFKMKKELVSLSEQNLVDCSVPEGDHGCGGGIMDFAFEYIIANGIDTEESYPYTAVQGDCKFDASKVGATIRSCVDIPSKSESSLEMAVATVGPISVAIDAGHSSFQLYDSGVYYEPACSETVLDHGVLAVGYGSEGGRNYWLVKNSWGGAWGDKGYIKMSKDRDNNCGIATQASYPVV